MNPDISGRGMLIPPPLAAGSGSHGIQVVMLHPSGDMCQPQHGHGLQNSSSGIVYNVGTIAATGGASTSGGSQQRHNTQPPVFLPTEGDIFSDGYISAPPTSMQVQPMRDSPPEQMAQSAAGDVGGLMTYAQLPPGATIVYLASPPIGSSVGPDSIVLSQSMGSTNVPPTAPLPHPECSKTDLHLPQSHPQVQLAAQSTPGAQFEDNFNVLSEDKETMLSIPRDMIDSTVGSTKYLQQGASACYTFRFQLCRGYSQGRCVHRHQCAFIHSRHACNPTLAAQVTRTQVHRNTPVARLDLAPYPRHPEGVTLLVYDSAQPKNELIDSSMIYVTHGSLAGYRAAAADLEHGGVTDMNPPDAQIRVLQDMMAQTQLQSNGPLSSSVRLQFCLHFDKSLCARGETCNFVHRVVIDPHAASQNVHAAQRPPLRTTSLHSDVLHPTMMSSHGPATIRGTAMFPMNPSVTFPHIGPSSYPIPQAPPSAGTSGHTQYHQGSYQVLSDGRTPQAIVQHPQQTYFQISTANGGPALPEAMMASTQRVQPHQGTMQHVITQGRFVQSWPQPTPFGLQLSPAAAPQPALYSSMPFPGTVQQQGTLYFT
jgi:hypothetical protein